MRKLYVQTTAMPTNMPVEPFTPSPKQLHVYKGNAYDSHRIGHADVKIIKISFCVMPGLFVENQYQDKKLYRYS